jgi:hypothetical protein
VVVLRADRDRRHAAVDGLPRGRGAVGRGRRRAEREDGPSHASARVGLVSRGPGVPQRRRVEARHLRAAAVPALAILAGERIVSTGTFGGRLAYAVYAAALAAYARSGARARSASSSAPFVRATGPSRRSSRPQSPPSRFD